MLDLAFGLQPTSRLGCQARCNVLVCILVLHLFRAPCTLLLLFVCLVIRLQFVYLASSHVHIAWLVCHKARHVSRRRSC